MSSKTQEEILNVIEENDGEVKGTFNLTLIVSGVNCLSHVIRMARKLQADGEIAIVQSKGGRGNMTVYKRNRNQPGLPRKTR